MIWLVCGGRAYRNMFEFSTSMYRLMLEIGRPTLVIHGAATGADTLADVWARQHQLPVTPVPADWTRHGRAAGPIRNEAMLRMGPHMVIAFPGGSGTEHMVSLATAQGVPVIRMPR